MRGLRRLEEGDIPFAMGLKDAAGWNQTADDWRSFLAFRPEGCFLALEDGRPAGTVTTIDYDGGFGWVGMVLVLKELRGRGIGTGLLEAAVESLAGTETVKLDATPAGRRVYVPMGFLDEYPLERRARAAGRHPPARSPPPGPASIRALRPEDLPAVAAYDAEVFGRSRRPVLAAWLRRRPEVAFLIEEHGALRGFCLGRRGSRAEHLGPLVAESFEGAAALLGRALEALEGSPVLLDAPFRDAAWSGLLEALGFQVERPFTRMYRGPNRFPGTPGRVWAIAGPEVG